ncbi:hypothetical protein [Streptomyces griseosporeus]|uniref:hypothetical protein n=1 Tax=Streptomyces griseosporeus TaxID=1910 RepID=UPI0036FB203D
MTTRGYPDYVSFTDAASIIVREGIAGSMTPRGLRYMATARSKEKGTERRWPFGDEPGQEPYLRAGRTRMMRTALLLEYLEKHPPTGRGPAREPRNTGSNG